MRKLIRDWRLSTFQIIIYSFAAGILLGAMLLCLPFATRDGSGASFFDALFTSVSAICVTGLVVKDTWQYWSLFGRCIIISLIQIGGLGIITVTLLIFIVSGKKISLGQRLIMKDAISADKVGGILNLTSFDSAGDLSPFSRAFIFFPSCFRRAAFIIICTARKAPSSRK